MQSRHTTFTLVPGDRAGTLVARFGRHGRGATSWRYLVDRCEEAVRAAEHRFPRGVRRLDAKLRLGQGARIELTEEGAAYLLVAWFADPIVQFWFERGALVFVDVQLREELLPRAREQVAEDTAQERPAVSFDPRRLFQ